MLIYSKINALRLYLNKQRKKGLQIGFVPTMGALHQGHLSLIAASQKKNDITVCSIFVNPLQFNNAKDLEGYPRLIAQDILLLEKQGCDVLFYPSAEEMYANEQEIPVVDLKGIDFLLEGAFRPGHFNGVVAVVKLLFDIVLPMRAYFGLKDYQQVMVVQQLVQQLGYNIEIVPVPTLREKDGLAMSSRNLRLTPDERKLATGIYQTFEWVKNNLGKETMATLTEQGKQKMNSIQGAKVEYFELVDAQTLLPVNSFSYTQKVVAIAAVYLGSVRLIDNMVLN